MKKRNVLTLVLVLVLVAALAVGATLAYFTDDDDVTNTFTMGKVDINLDESNSVDENGDPIWDEDGLEYTDVLPGDPTDKTARVTLNADSEDCQLMMTVQVDADPAFTEDDVALLYDAIIDAIDPTVWDVEDTGDGLRCIYNGVLSVEEENTEAILFEQITIPAELGNNVAESGFRIVLNAYAIQNDNLEGEPDWDDVIAESTPQQ